VRTPTSLRRVNLEDGAVQQIEELPAEFFGEGLVLWGDKLIQLTWRNQVAFVYDMDSFEQIGQFNYETEGWGLTHDGRQLIMSDGSSTLTFRDPETFAETGRVQVFAGEQPIDRLNELEYIDGEVWANIWQTNRIARIDPETGQVNSWLDLTGLLDTSNLTETVDVLNGIAYDAENGRLFVTGKLWPTLFEIELIPVAE
jgi:glutamine cyclotransferase